MDEEPFMNIRAPVNAPRPIVAAYFEQDSTGVTATINALGSSSQYEVRAKYMISADGGRSLGPQLGLKLEGETNLGRLVTAPFLADLSPYLPGDAMITHLFHPSRRFRCFGGACAGAVSSTRELRRAASLTGGSPGD